MLERRGATVIRCPLVAIRDAPDPQPVLAWCREFAGGACDDLVLLTGEGLRRLLSCMDQHEARVARAVRRPARARAQDHPRPEACEGAPRAGIEAGHRGRNHPPPTASSPACGASRSAAAASGFSFTVRSPTAPLVDFLKTAGASVSAVAPYVYADAADDRAVH